MISHEKHFDPSVHLHKYTSISISAEINKFISVQLSNSCLHFAVLRLSKIEFHIIYLQTCHIFILEKIIFPKLSAYFFKVIHARDR